MGKEDNWAEEYYSDQDTIKKLEAEIRYQYQVIADERDNTKTQKKAREAEQKKANLEKQVEKLKSKWRWMKDMAITKDTVEILRLSGFTVDEEVSPKFKKVMGEYGKGELKSSSGEKVTDPKQAKAIAYSEAGETKDAKFEVMYTIGHFHDPETLKDKKEIIQANSAGEARRMIENKWKGNLNRIIQITQVHDSDCGKIFTKGTEDGGPGSGIKGHTTSRSGYKMEDPKEIESAIKKVKASGHPNPQYLAGLERALKIAKEERGIKDSCGEKVFTKGTEDDDATKEGAIKEYGDNGSLNMEDEGWITVNGAHVKVEEGESKESATKKFIKKKGGNPAPEGGSKKSTAPSKSEGSTKTYKPGETLRNSEGKRIGKVEKEFKNIRGEEMVKAMKSPYAWAPTYVKKSDLDHRAGYEKLEATAQEKTEFKKDLDNLVKIQKAPVDNSEEFYKAEDDLREKYMGLDLPIYTYGNVDWEEIRNEFRSKKTKDSCFSKDCDSRLIECNEVLKLSGFIS